MKVEDPSRELKEKVEGAILFAPPDLMLLLDEHDTT